MDIRPQFLPPDGFRGDGPFRGALVQHVDGGGPSTLAWVIFALLLALLLLAIASLALDLYRSRRARATGATGTPPRAVDSSARALALLDDRYARGEVSRDEYLQARDDLRGTADAATQVIPPDPEPEAA
ncbi:MAG TPA: SHOCT domain-containing protein [Gaiellaceae bacterium]|jgi:putative membrane protein